MEDLDRRFSSQEVLPEDIQDQTVPMIILGSDVVNLYPSLDTRKVVGEVKNAILDSDIKWEEMDYLEAARYVALNWPEEKCRRSELRRVLPKRRGTRGTRPGLTENTVGEETVLRATREGRQDQTVHVVE